jgi:NADH-quinone oxidoreductase subunit N
MLQLDLTAIGAEIVLATTGVLVLIADMFLGEKKKAVLAAIVVAGVVLSGAAVMNQFQANEGQMTYMVTDQGTFSQDFTKVKSEMGLKGDGSVIVDNFSVIFKYIFLLALALTAILSVSYIRREEMAQGEYYALLVFCTLGMMVMASAGDMLTLFLGLETLSIPIYVLAGYQSNRIKGNESGLKYLLTGAFASGFMLYGISFIYGATGTMSLHRIGVFLTLTGGEISFFMLMGITLLFIGFAFKIAAVPFHMWTPDVYQGAPTPITAFMSVAVKAAAFAGLMRVLLIVVPFGSLLETMKDSIWWVAVITMTAGNLLALSQKNIKRMLAYSSISHAGYLLIGVLTAMTLGSAQMAMSGILFYLIAYTLMNIGAFAVILIVARKGDKFEKVEDFAGLAIKHPALAVMMTIFLLSLAGFPPTAGFFGKFYLFSAAVSADLVPLVIIAVLNSLVSVVYYLRPVMMMYFKPLPEDDDAEAKLDITFTAQFVLAFSAFSIFLLGIIPNRIVSFVSRVVGF